MQIPKPRNIACSQRVHRRGGAAPPGTGTAGATTYRSTAHSGKATSGCVSTRRRSNTRIRRTGASSGPVSPSTISSAADVAEQQVLDHVRVQQFLARATEAAEGPRDHRDSPP